MGLKNRKIIFGVLVLSLFLAGFVSAGPYGYGDSMDLKYHVSDDKIVYGYGDSLTKYQTSLRPKYLNWSEWRKTDSEIMKSVSVEKTWTEILNEDLPNGKNNFLGINNFWNVLSNKLLTPLFGFVNADEISSSEEIVLDENYGGCGLK